MEFSREEFMNELKLRKYIRKAIKIVKERRKIKNLDEDKKLRALVRKAVLQEKEREPLYPETGKNFLDALFLDTGFLGRIKTGYKELKSTQEQRDTYRTHIIYHVLRTLETQSAMRAPGDNTKDISKVELSEQDETTISVIDQDDRLMGTEPEKETPEEKEDKELEAFKVPRVDEYGDITGIKQAKDIFNKTEVKESLLRYWNRMGNSDDEEVFYDNMKEQLTLYFDTWEEEVQEEIAKSKAEETVELAPEESPLGEPEALELEPEIPEEELELEPIE
tara:strand:- start:2131 stop:2964 length:834 start_codon:yes stop_codon:yes gene_type:complete